MFNLKVRNIEVTMTLSSEEKEYIEKVSQSVQLSIEDLVMLSILTLGKENTKDVVLDY